MKNRGFTLIELLVVISIIGILSTIGFMAFQGVQKTARDTKRKADVATIAKALEMHYNQATKKYQPLDANWFSQGIPKPPRPTSDGTGDGENYDGLDKITTSSTYFDVCAKLETGEQNLLAECSSDIAQGCFCIKSLQGGTVSSGGGGGGGGGIPSNCSASLTTGLVSFWKMNESSWGGAAPQANNTVTGGLNGTVTGATISTSGKFGNAGSFINGNYINFGNTFPVITNNFSIVAWVNTNTTTNNQQGVVARWPTDEARLSYMLGLSVTNIKVLFRVVGSDNIYHGNVSDPVKSELESSTALSKNAWHFIAAVKEDITGKVYIDGSTPDVTTTSFPTGMSGFQSQNNFYIGQWGDWGDSFNGLIDNVMIYSKALDETEISDLYRGCLQN